MCGHQPMALLVYTRPDKFIKANHPTMTHVIVVAKGGDAGTDSDGNPGAPGRTNTVKTKASALPDVVHVVIGKGGRGAPGFPDGKDGYTLVSVYDCGD